MKNKLLYLLLSALGFGGCADWRDEPVMYGTPRVDITLRGRVSSGGNTIPGIGVSGPDGYPVLTDGAGVFELHLEPMGIGSFDLRFQDVDGAENGIFDPLVHTVEVTESDRTSEGDGSWYDGAFEVDGIEVSLTGQLSPGGEV